jgi:hypothetical protein
VSFPRVLSLHSRLTACTHSCHFLILECFNLKLFTSCADLVSEPLIVGVVHGAHVCLGLTRGSVVALRDYRWDAHSDMIYISDARNILLVGTAVDAETCPECDGPLNALVQEQCQCGKSTAVPRSANQDTLTWYKKPRVGI